MVEWEGWGVVGLVSGTERRGHLSVTGETERRAEPGSTFEDLEVWQAASKGQSRVVSQESRV